MLNANKNIFKNVTTRKKISEPCTGSSGNFFLFEYLEFRKITLKKRKLNYELKHTKKREKKVVCFKKDFVLNVMFGKIRG